MVQTDYKFDISISLRGYDSKKAINWRDIKFHKQTLTMDQFEEFIARGYIFTHIFNKDFFGMTYKICDNWLSTNVIFIDIDECGINIDEFISNLTYPPTLFYTTNSHTDECPRFRIVYCFVETIDEIKTYQHIYMSLIRQMEKDNNFTNKDNCGKTVTQVFFGNPSNCYLQNNCYIYSIDEVMDDVEDEQPKIKSSKTKGNNNVDIFNKTFIQQYNDLPPLDFKLMNESQYPLILHSPLPMVDEDIPYILLDKHYECNFIPKHIKDGELRRKQLFLRAMIRRNIKNDITPEHLLINMLDDYFNCDNTNHTIHKWDMVEIVIRAMSENLEDWRDFGMCKSKYKVNNKYCEKYKLSPLQVSRLSKKILQMEEVMSVYDYNLTDKENIDIMKKQGIDC